MAFLNDELVKRLRGFGYRVKFGPSGVILKNNSAPAHFLSILFILAGVGCLWWFIDFQIALLGIIFLATGFLNLRRTLARSLTFDTAEKEVRYRSGLLGLRKKQSFSEIKGFSVHEFSRSSHTSPFLEGNRDYYADILLEWSGGKKIELFRFISRNQDELGFATAIPQELTILIEKSLSD